MSRLRWFVREWMIGWHQGARERAEREMRRHFDAETKWRYRA